MAPLQLSAAWAKFSLQMGGQDAAHPTAEAGAEYAPAHVEKRSCMTAASKKQRHIGQEGSQTPEIISELDPNHMEKYIRIIQGIIGVIMGLYRGSNF